MKDIYFANSKISKVFVGSQQVYSSEPRVFFESNIPGTYTVDIPSDGDYEVICIGSGGNGYIKAGFNTSNTMKSGGSGAGFVGILHINEGTYTVVLPFSGSGLSYTTSAFNILAGCGGNASSSSAGKGGVLNISNANVISYTLAKNGNDGKNSPSNVTTSVYKSYGRGGMFDDGTVGMAEPTAGYIKISEI